MIPRPQPPSRSPRIPSTRPGVATAALLLLTAQCSKGPSSRPSETAASTLRGLPIVMTVKQRSTTVVPGSGDALRLTIDDITRGQVMATLNGEAGAVLLGTTSFTPGTSAAFRLGEKAYLLTLKELRNELVGEDYGTFEVSAFSATGSSEVEKIERLLSMVASMKDAAFIRNGAEQFCTEAADHLRSKWEAAGSRVRTAREFVDQVAARSAATGEPYRILFPDGRLVEVGEYLGERLAEIENRR